MRYRIRKGNVIHRKAKKQTAYEKKQMSDLTEKDFKGAIKNTFKVLKETMLKEVKELMMMTSHLSDYHKRDRNDKTEPNGNSGIGKCNNSK